MQQLANQLEEKDEMLKECRSKVEQHETENIDQEVSRLTEQVPPQQLCRSGPIGPQAQRPKG